MSMKLSDYAEQHGICYKTAWRWFRSGQIKGRQMPSGTIFVDEPNASTGSSEHGSHASQISHANLSSAVIYTRVSSSENKANLDTQANRLISYCAAKGWKIDGVVKEVGSGLNEHRPKLMKILADPDVKLLVVEHKDRLTRFGFSYIEALFDQRGGRIEVINAAESRREDLIQDFVSVITSFCARIYGQRRCSRKTEGILAVLAEENMADVVGKKEHLSSQAVSSK